MVAFFSYGSIFAIFLLPVSPSIHIYIYIYIYFFFCDFQFQNIRKTFYENLHLFRLSFSLYCSLVVQKLE